MYKKISKWNNSLETSIVKKILGLEGLKYEILGVLHTMSQVPILQVLIQGQISTFLGYRRSVENIKCGIRTYSVKANFSTFSLVYSIM